jgi:hypothetical protein
LNLAERAANWFAWCLADHQTDLAAASSACLSLLLQVPALRRTKPSGIWFNTAIERAATSGDADLDWLALARYR